MHEIGLNTSLLQQVLAGTKTVECRLGKPDDLKIRVGDNISLREDIWQDGEVVERHPEQGIVVVRQLLYFGSFVEMLNAVDYHKILPSAHDKQDVINTLRQFYNEADEEEYGVIAVTFQLVR